MSAEEAEQPPRKRRRKIPTSTGSYILRPLVEDIALATEEYETKVKISCVELWEGNLYIGTSAAEILHYVSIPNAPDNPSENPSYIFASRLQPTFTNASDGKQRPGVQQILVLPKVAKACVLCNGTLTFYTLPELSPAFNTVVPNCSWVGGANLNANREAEEDGETIMLCLRNQVRLVNIGDKPRKIRNIEYPACLTSSRRDNFACVADARSYALLDVENQQKISLFPISSLDDNVTGGQVEDISTRLESSRPSSVSGSGDFRGHGRSTSLGNFVTGLGRRSPQSTSRERSTQNTPEPRLRTTSPVAPQNRDKSAESPTKRLSTPGKPLPPPPNTEAGQEGVQANTVAASANLVPHICSPTPSEFLLTTGTTLDDPGVGIFVNLDGDVVRGTLQFRRYPTSVVVDEINHDRQERSHDGDSPEGFVLATVSQQQEEGNREVIEIQRWDIEDGGRGEYLAVPFPFEEDNVEDTGYEVGSVALRSLCSSYCVPFPEVGDKLRAVRIRVSREGLVNPADQNRDAKEDWELKRDGDEKTFAHRLGSQRTHIAVWSGSSIWWVTRNPLAMQLDEAIDQAMDEESLRVDRSEIIQVVNRVRGQEANTETEFLSLEYIRQKSSLILIADMIAQPSNPDDDTSADWRITEGLLIEGGVDPRVTLSLMPPLHEEIVEGSKGIWIHAGLVPVVEHYSKKIFSGSSSGTQQSKVLSSNSTLHIIKRYLYAWRQRKGFGSIADEVEVFQSIDAALLRVLLHQDRNASTKTGVPSAARSELYALVDQGLDCFERAAALLEQCHRLYVLSRLYQSRKQSGKVLETWRRIIDGERDDGGELRDGDNEVRRYLAKIKDISLIHEYGTWLARRNPALGVQIFSDDNSRIRFSPQDVVKLLQEKAPAAVKVYLEHLVFGKKNVQYANNLISYYLDSVLQVLGSSEDARSILLQSYESYRALQPPKPTYRQFIIDNSISETWWHDRLRLLELLGGSHGADFNYDVDDILARIEPFEQHLVPESIILDGRQGRHQQALRLLTHGLGDYHTAINYCLMGGASMFHPISGTLTPHTTSTGEDQSTLFEHLLTEFLSIDDASNRLERTSELLERFGSWYNVSQVLERIPDDWSVELVSGFLISAFRRLVVERNEAAMTKALSSADNLKVAASFVEKCTAIGPRVEEIQ
ncbi:MAG: hypothetical protein Q9214_002918 [Letrouitia sp. 1 TL-2023]